MGRALLLSPHFYCRRFRVLLPRQSLTGTTHAVKTFVGHPRGALDKQVNDWLAASNVEVRKTDVAFKAYRDRGRMRSQAGLHRAGNGIAINNLIR